MSELGTAGVAFDPDLVAVAYGGVTVCSGGVAADHDAAAVRAPHGRTTPRGRCATSGSAAGSGAVLTTDLGHGYIDENRTTS